jgi:hypothetical protein
MDQLMEQWTDAPREILVGMTIAEVRQWREAGFFVEDSRALRFLGRPLLIVDMPPAYVPAVDEITEQA